jgi:hypothetical protein
LNHFGQILQAVISDHWMDQKTIPLLLLEVSA